MYKIEDYFHSDMAHKLFTRNVKIVIPPSLQKAATEWYHAPVPTSPWRVSYGAHHGTALLLEGHAQDYTTSLQGLSYLLAVQEALQQIRPTTT